VKRVLKGKKKVEADHILIEKEKKGSLFGNKLF
jgi:hypothetical protein